MSRDKSGMSSKKSGGNGAALRFIFVRLSRCLWLVLVLAGLGSVGSLCGVWFALMSKRVLDIATGAVPGDLMTTGYVLLAVLLGQALLNAFMQTLNTYTVGKFEIALKNDILTHAIASKYSSLVHYHSGDLLNRLISDVGVVVGGVVGMLPNVVSLSVRLIAAVWALSVLAPGFAQVLLSAGLVLLLFRRIFSTKLKLLHKKQQAADGQMRSYFAEVLQNVAVVKAFNASALVSAQANRLQSALLKSRMIRTIFGALASIATQLTFSGAYYATMLWGAFAIASGDITFGTLTAFLQLVNQVQGPLYGASGMVSQYYGMIASAERLMEITTLYADALPKPVGAVNTLVCENLHFTYEGDESVLSGFDMRVARGTIVGLKGPSGIGKTTLFKLLFGFFEPQSGKIYLETDRGNLRVDASTRSAFAYYSEYTEQKGSQRRKICSKRNPRLRSNHPKPSPPRRSCARTIHTPP